MGKTKKPKIHLKARFIKWLVEGMTEHGKIDMLSPAVPKGFHIHKDPIKKEKA